MRLRATILLLALGTTQAGAQIPRINTLFPIGGKAGTTVEVELRGANLDGAEQILVTGSGVSGSVVPGGAKSDDKFRPLWQSKCGSCHELRSPSNRSMTPAQWGATVDRMVKVRGAQLSVDEQDKVTQFLQSAARAGRVTAKITIDTAAKPGIYEVRALTGRGISTATLFEVGALPEVTGINGKLESAQLITFPCVANGSLTGNAERHYYRFTAHKAQRLVFDLKGYRYRESNQLFFNPDLRLYDSGGAEIAENHGFYDLDPLLDWTCPADGEYTIEVRDLLGRGNPGSIYRLRMGELTYEPADSPGASRPSIVAFARPDNVSLRAGSSTTVEIILTQRPKSAINVEALDLPAGVTAAPLVIPPDRQGGFITLTAAADAASSARPIRIKVGDIPIVPQELYKFNGNDRTIDRAECVVAVCGKPQFTASFAESGPIRVQRRKGTEIEVKVQRVDGYTGPISIRLLGLPSGWTANPDTIPAGKDSIKLLVRPDGNNQNPFLTRDSVLPPYEAILDSNADEFHFTFGFRTVSHE